MRENRIRELLNEVSMPEEKKEEVWDSIVKAVGRKRRYLHKRAAAAVAVLVLLLIPVSIQAAGIFKWDWEAMGEKNEQLDMNFRRENGCVEGGGFRFCVEQAMCSEEIGLVYYYISVTDISGKGRNPRDYMIGYEKQTKRGDIVYHIMSSGAGSEKTVYDSVNSTENKAYFYVKDIGKPGVERKEKMGEVRTEVCTVEKEQQGQHSRELAILTRETIPVQNVVEMPVLLWRIPVHDEETKQDKEVTVWASTILAHVCNTTYNRTFEIVLKDGTSILDCEESGKNISSDRVFTSIAHGTNPISTYEYDYTDIDNIRGIWLDGQYYSAEKAERRLSK